jgi:putative sugar O-methyltransferase
VIHGELTGDFAERIVSAVERSGGSVRAGRPPAPAVGARLARPVLMRVAARVAAAPGALRARETRVARLRRSREIAAAARRTGLISARQTAAGERGRQRQERAAHRDARRRGRAAEEAAAEARRAAALAVSREQFEQARAWASRLRTQGAVELSDVERGLAEDLAPLWSLGPDAVATLRHWSAVITGDRPEQYRDGEANAAEAGVTSWHREFYGRQKELGPALMVSDADVLGGGFGWIRNEIRYNADTLRYMHAAGALSDAAVLPAFRNARTRQVVWEIGGGWGGFAHYFKTLCPNVTYLITGLPETLIVSATFLQAAFPDARCHFHERGTNPWDGAADADFVFAPEGALDDLRPSRLDLTLDLGGLAQMTPERLSVHMRRAFECGSRFFYAMLPPEPLADGDAAVRGAIERYFWPHPVAPRPVSHDARSRGEGVPRYTHLVGWRRIRV